MASTAGTATEVETMAETHTTGALSKAAAEPTPGVAWPDNVDEVLAGDQAIVLATVTPARGVVLLPVTNFGVRNREAGTIDAVNSSVGVSRKLERMRANPRIAIVYHTRRHAFTQRPEYVLAQGRARLSEPDPRYVDSVPAEFQRYAGGFPKGDDPLSRWWLRGWHTRMGIGLDVERIVVWPDLRCAGDAVVHGTPLPEDPPPPQSPPRNGTGPRVDRREAARAIDRLPDALLGWVGADGFPTVAPVGVAATEPRGLVLDVAPGLVPPGGRRAGLTAHWFARFSVGQRLRIHTGWVENDGERVVYAPHTRTGYWMPPSPLVYKLAAGAVTNWGLRTARRRGFLPG
jgi:hypothetical protein